MGFAKTHSKGAKFSINTEGFEFRKISTFPLNKEIIKIAEKASEILGLTFCGVDIIKGKDNYYLTEVNSNPLINNLTEICNINPGMEIGNIIKNL